MRPSDMNYRRLQYGLLIVLALVFCKTNGEVQCNHSRELSSIAFVNVYVVSMDGKSILENQTVIAQEGRIAQIGKVTEVDILSNAMLIDGKGKYLMPGLCDIHTHIPYKNDFIF
jgi:imidazolonepropionase-like amidohydrolase